MDTVAHPYVKEGSIEQRSYQEKIIAAVAGHNALVVLPTGLGKTIIAALLCAHKLASQGGKTLFLAPTKPLVLQHRETFANVLNVPDEALAAFTGSTPPAKRSGGYGAATVIFATPQVIENDILAGRIALSDISLLIVDEAHRATGDYASPGYDRKRIKEIMANLGADVLHIEQEDSPDVAPYVQSIEVEWVKVSFPKSLERSRDLLRLVYEDKLSILLRMRLTSKPRQYINKRDLLAMGELLRGRLTKKTHMTGDAFAGIKAQAAAVKLLHAIELLETQGAQSMLAYMDKLASQRSKSAKELLGDPRVKEAISLAGDHEACHPKVDAVLGLLGGMGQGQKAIVFSQFRDTTLQLMDALAGKEGIRPLRFVGQASRDNDEGLSQKRQKELLDEFRSGSANVLIATSVAEEGLDIPSVDLVVFFEPIPSEIRTIQRRGRTGRRHAGRVVVLTTQGTMDEAYYHVAREKEKKMRTLLTRMEGTAPQQVQREQPAQSQLDAFVPTPCTIVADVRENPQMLKLLSASVTLQTRQLDVGDYVVSDRIGVERKSSEDFVRTLFDNRLFEQLRALKAAYETPILIIEGERTFTAHDAHVSSIRGAIATIAADMGIGIIHSSSLEESAAYLILLARREQEQKAGVPRARGDKRERDMRSQMVFIVEGLPGVSAKLARRLLEHFGSVGAVFSASAEDLMGVEGIGEKTAERIREAIEAGYAS
jgi:Fanconi anemia group M protein